MSKAVIQVENVSKQYRLGEVGTGSLKDDFKRFRYKLMGKEDPFLKIGEVNDRTKIGSSDYVWALKDINFSVQQGEVLGIIGRNGAGKSTLLKLLSRTTGPTTGSIKMKGRIASLLEVGTGFHGELSGRENIYLNGAIMGLRKHEITKKLDEIIDFAGVERYLDTPVKRYSSGMYVRLAFAVAAHLEPDILIVDEVLAVGDAEFQKKCLGKMQDPSQKGGRTILFVSHNMPAVRKISERVMIMNKGSIEFVGATELGIDKYFDAAHNKKYSRDLNYSDSSFILSIEILNIEEKIDISEVVQIQVSYVCNHANQKLSLSLALFDKEQNYVFNSPSGVSEIQWSGKNHTKGIYTAIAEIPKHLLNTGIYYPMVLLIEDGVRVIDEVKEVVAMEMCDKTVSLGFTGTWGGIVRPNLNWKIEKK